MRQAFNMIFASIATIFSAVNYSAKAVENYAKWADAESGAFLAESTVEHQARMSALREKVGIPAPAAPAVLKAA